MRMLATSLGCAFALLTTGLSGPADAQRLGQSRGLTYLKAVVANVVSQAGAEAHCGKNESVTGGGGSISGATRNASLNATYPVVNLGQAWQAEGSTTGGGGRTVTSYAICGRPEVQYASFGTTSEPDTVFSSGGDCGPTASVTGGGVRGQGGRLLIAATHPGGMLSSRWLSLTRNAGPGDSQVNHYRGCSEGYDLRVRSASTRIAADAAGKAIARCPSKQAVTGGGLRNRRGSMVESDAWAVATRPWDSRQDRRKTPDDGWLVRAHNGGDARVTLTAFAVCKRGSTN